MNNHALECNEERQKSLKPHLHWQRKFDAMIVYKAVGRCYPSSEESVLMDRDRGD